MPRSIDRAGLGAADVIVDNFAPGTMERWRLGYGAGYYDRTLAARADTSAMQ